MASFVHSLGDGSKLSGRFLLFPGPTDRAGRVFYSITSGLEQLWARGNDKVSALRRICSVFFPAKVEGAVARVRLELWGPSDHHRDRGMDTRSSSRNHGGTEEGLSRHRTGADACS